MEYSLLNTLNTNKKRTSLIEYALHIGEQTHKFLVEESAANDFEKQFSESEIKSYEEFVQTFGELIRKR